MREIAIQISNLTKSFHQVKVIDQMNFSCSKADAIGILGSNGAGKTTLLNLLCGFLLPESGAITVLGKEITHWSPFKRFQLGIFRSFQNNRLADELTIEDHMMLAMNEISQETFKSIFLSKKDFTNRIDCFYEHLHALGLSTYIRKPVKILSYGQKKLVTIACCLVSQSPISLLDEPFSGLSEKMLDLSVGLIEKALRGNCCLIIVEHDVQSMLRVVDRVVFMSSGAPIIEVKPSDLYGNSKILSTYLRNH